MKKSAIILLLILTTNLFAQKPIEILLWADGAPTDNELKGEENTPTLTVYLPSNGNGKAIVMCPGGGYSHLAMNHEGHDMAQWFNAQGIVYAVLKYRMPNGHSDVPLSDAEQAMRIVREHAKEWKIDSDKIGIMGASAGGHLASTLATHYSSELAKPNFQILLYPVVTMIEGITHSGSRNNLIENAAAGSEKEVMFCNEKQVNSQTPAAFIALSSDDKVVPPANSINYYTALLQNNIPASLHIYPLGGHGWGFNDSFPYKRQWTEELEKWIRELY